MGQVWSFYCPLPLQSFFNFIVKNLTGIKFSFPYRHIYYVEKNEGFKNKHIKLKELVKMATMINIQTKKKWKTGRDPPPR
jgi:hypothetical protein